MRPARDVPVEYLDHLIREDQQDAILKMKNRIHRTIEGRLAPHWPEIKRRYMDGWREPPGRSGSHPWLSGDLTPHVRCQHKTTLVLGTGWYWAGIGNDFVPFLGWRLWTTDGDRLDDGSRAKPQTVNTWVSRQIGGSAERNLRGFSQALGYIESCFAEAARVIPVDRGN